MPTSTPDMCPVGTTQQMALPEESWAPQTHSFLPFPSHMLSGPTFGMQQMLQLGLEALPRHTSATNSTRTLASAPPSPGTSTEYVRRSALPQQHGMTTPNCLQAILAKNRADRHKASSPLSDTAPHSHPLPPAQPHCLAKECLLKW